MEPTDIIKGCKQGKRVAQRAFVDTYSGYMFTICRRYTTSEFEAQDCLQDSLMQVLTKIDKYQPTGKFKNWISRVTVTKCLENMRKNKRHNNIELGPTDEPMIDENVLYKLELDDVMKFMDSLPYNARVAINMYLIEGFSHKEIGAFLSLTESASRSLVSRTRKLIKDRFKSENLSIVYKANRANTDLDYNYAAHQDGL